MPNDTAATIEIQREALERARGILSYGEDSEHAPRGVACDRCRNFWNAVTDHPEPDSAEPAAILEELSAHVPPAPHPLASCAACDGCRFELGVAMATIELGRAGVDEDMAWGPGHSEADTDHAAGDAACPTCREWAAGRAAARTACRDAGVDADRWLGPDGTPQDVALTPADTPDPRS